MDVFVGADEVEAPTDMEGRDRKGAWSSSWLALGGVVQEGTDCGSEEATEGWPADLRVVPEGCSGDRDRVSNAAKRCRMSRSTAVGPSDGGANEYGGYGYPSGRWQW